MREFVLDISGDDAVSESQLSLTVLLSRHRGQQLQLGQVMLPIPGSEAYSLANTWEKLDLEPFSEHVFAAVC